MAKGEKIFNDIKVSLSCAKCDFVTESHKELLKHKRMHRLSRSTRVSKWNDKKAGLRIQVRHYPYLSISSIWGNKVVKTDVWATKVLAILPPAQIQLEMWSFVRENEAKTGALADVWEHRTGARLETKKGSNLSIPKGECRISWGQGNLDSPLIEIHPLTLALSVTH